MRPGLCSILAGLSIILGSRALLAETPMEYFSRHISESRSSGNDGLLFHTDEGRVLVLADDKGRIGAILVHTRNRSQKADRLVNKLLALVNSREEPTIRYSKDRYSAMVLYEDVAEAAADEDGAVIDINRLGSLYNICNKEEAEWTPHRWHDGGISFRYYDDGNLAAEITPDMTEDTVSYAEIRIADDYRTLLPTALAGHEHRITGDRNAQRQLSITMGGATVLSSDSFGNTHVARLNDVSCAGTTERLISAHRRRRNISHYIFPDFDFPRQRASVSTPTRNNRPIATGKQQPPPDEPPEKPEPTTEAVTNTKPEPEQKQPRSQAELLKAYIDYLNQIR